MSEIKREPGDEEMVEAANKAIDHLIEIGVLEEWSSRLEDALGTCLKNFFDAIAEQDEDSEDPPGKRPGYITATNLLVINNERYWLTSREWKRVEEIKTQYPNVWENIVLQRMNTRSL